MTSIILLKKQEDVLIFNLSDTGAAATVGTNKDGFVYCPKNYTITNLILVCDAAPTGANLIADLNVNGTSILSTKISIDVGKTNSITSTTPYVLNTTSINLGSKFTVDVDQIGTGGGTNVQLILYCTKKAAICPNIFEPIIRLSAKLLNSLVLQNNPFTKLIALGDSWTKPNGIKWVETACQELGIIYNVNDNFAVGGATSSELDAQITSVLAANNTSLLATSLISVNIGGNDIFAGTAISTVLTNIQNGLIRLLDAGARFILLDKKRGIDYLGIGSPNPTQDAAFTAYGVGITAMIKTLQASYPHASFSFYSTNDFIESVYYNPTTYGFVSAGIGNYPVGLFADSVHLTEAGYIQYGYWIARSIANTGKKVSGWSSSIDSKLLTTSNSATQPIYLPQGLNGLPTLRFDGVDDFLQYTEGLGAKNGVTVYVVGKMRQVTSTGLFCGEWLNGYTRVGENQWVIGHNAFGIESGTPAPLGQTFAAVAGFTNEAVLAVGNYNLSSSNINTNGTTNTAAQTGAINSSSAPFIIGKSADWAECSYIDISEIIVYPRSLSAKEDSQIKVYIAHEWGVG